MHCSVTFTVLLACLQLAVASAPGGSLAVMEACRQIESSVSPASSVHYPGSDPIYTQDISHYVVSSTTSAACAVEPGSTEDVAMIVNIVGTTRTPFAVKGGGHAMNPNFSSTTGVQIAMYRFNEVIYDPDANTAEVGAGLVWDEVYTTLQQYNVTVVGGRFSGIGVAGLTLGGGYSWKSNQYGLAVDNVAGYELVLPNGTATSVTQSQHSDLFWALKGGFNNFGIVTKFTLKTHPQTPAVWGGTITFALEDFSAFDDAVVKFANAVTDPKASIMAGYVYTLNTLLASVNVFYDGPTPPAGIFDDFLALPSVQNNVQIRSLVDLLQPAPANTTGRGVYHTASHLEYTDAIMKSIFNETQFWGQRMANTSVTVMGILAEPFLPTLFSHAAEGSSAYPPSRARALFPSGIYYEYADEDDDEVVYDVIRQNAAQLTRATIDDGQDVEDAALYGNYAVFDTPLERIYGKNVQKLREVKERYDPHEVMNLAGGWRF